MRNEKADCALYMLSVFFSEVLVAIYKMGMKLSLLKYLAIGIDLIYEEVKGRQNTF